MESMTLAASRMVEVCLLTALASVGSAVAYAVPFAQVAGQEAATQNQPQSTSPDSAPQSRATQEKQSDQKKSDAATVQKRRTKKRRPGSASTKQAPPKPAGADSTNENPPKVIVKNGGTTDPTEKIAPEMSQQQASSQRQKAKDLLTGTDVNLKKISGRRLNSNQQDMVKQIQQYVEQAKAAGDAGDLEREHNLAVKANLLSQALLK